MKGADLLITHLDLTSQAMQLAMSTKIPLVHFVHNDSQLMYWRVDARVPYKNALAVYNSHWLAAKQSQWAGQIMPREWLAPSITIHPVVEPHHYRCERGDAITLVNPTPGKGVATFQALAVQMPDRKFLAVEGGYGEQMIVEPGSNPRKPRVVEASGNIEWMAHTPDIREVFRKTKILLMPSDYESYGRVGIEAACAAIPTICHPTEGLKEAFGDAGIFIDRNDIAAWYVEIDRLLTDDLYYRKRSDIVLALADSLEPEKEFDRLEKAFLETVERWRRIGDPNPMMWKSDRFIWKMGDGSFKAVSDQRIPTGAVTLYAGIGTEIPQEIALKNGWFTPEGKAVEAPEENKAIEAPAENKARGRRKKEAA